MSDIHKKAIKTKSKLAQSVQKTPLETLVQCFQARKALEQEAQELEEKLIPKETKRAIKEAKEKIKTAKAMEQEARELLVEEKIRKGNLRAINVINKKGENLCQISFRKKLEIELLKPEILLQDIVSGSGSARWINFNKSHILKDWKQGYVKLEREGTAFRIHRKITSALKEADKEEENEKEIKTFANGKD